MRIALGVEYDGSSFQGFQRQKNLPSVQQTLEEAISKIAAEPISILCAGRTDTGVNATQQVVHFDYNGKTPRSLYSWLKGTNVFLPTSVSVKWSREVPDDFHARFSAFSRTYRYILLNTPSKPAILFNGISHYPGKKLDEKLMHEAGQYLLGENDFTSFRSSECQSNTPFRNVHELKVNRMGDYVIIEITANAFLHHMVRNIVGSLLQVGYGKQKPIWIQELLNAKDRTLAAENAQPNGLYLVGVGYDEKYNLPSYPTGPLWLN